MKSLTRSKIIKVIEKMEKDSLLPTIAAAELRQILREDLADTIERKIRFS